jgi:hypothetical protein
MQADGLFQKLFVGVIVQGRRPLHSIAGYSRMFAPACASKRIERIQRVSRKSMFPSCRNVLKGPLMLHQIAGE